MVPSQNPTLQASPRLDSAAVLEVTFNPNKTAGLGLGLFNMDLDDFRLGNGGRLLYDFLGVGDIPAEDIEDLLTAVRTARSDTDDQPAKA